MSYRATLKQLIADAGSLATFIEAAEAHNVPTDAQADALRRHVWGEDVPPDRVRTILERERQRLDESEWDSSSGSAQAPRYMDLADLELVSGYEFEHLLVEILRRVGGETTIASGVQGVDVVWKRAEETVGIHAKANDTTDPVGARSVRAAHASVSAADSDYSIDVPAVVTTSGYTEEAKTAATESGVRLYGRSDLGEWLSEARLDAATMGEILDAI